MEHKAWSHDKEYFNSSTLGELIDNNSELCVGDTVYVGNARTPDTSRYVCTDRILEQIGDSAYDDIGEHSDGWPNVAKEEQILLEEMIVDFLDKHSPISFYQVFDIEEYTITSGDIE